MEIKPKNAYKYLGISYRTTNTVNLLYVQSEMCHKKDIVEKLQGPMRKYKLLSFKMYVINTC